MKDYSITVKKAVERGYLIPLANCPGLDETIDTDTFKSLAKSNVNLGLLETQLASLQESLKVLGVFGTGISTMNEPLLLSKAMSKQCYDWKLRTTKWKNSENLEFDMDAILDCIGNLRTTMLGVGHLTGMTKGLHVVCFDGDSPEDAQFILRNFKPEENLVTTSSNGTSVDKAKVWVKLTEPQMLQFLRRLNPNTTIENLNDLKGLKVMQPHNDQSDFEIFGGNKNTAILGVHKVKEIDGVLYLNHIRILGNTLNGIDNDTLDQCLLRNPVIKKEVQTAYHTSSFNQNFGTLEERATKLELRYLPFLIEIKEQFEGFNPWKELVFTINGYFEGNEDYSMKYAIKISEALGDLDDNGVKQIELALAEYHARVEEGSVVKQPSSLNRLFREGFKSLSLPRMKVLIDHYRSKKIEVSWELEQLEVKEIALMPYEEARQHIQAKYGEQPTDQKEWNIVYNFISNNVKLVASKHTNLYFCKPTGSTKILAAAIQDTGCLHYKIPPKHHKVFYLKGWSEMNQKIYDGVISIPPKALKGRWKNYINMWKEYPYKPRRDGTIENQANLDYFWDYIRQNWCGGVESDFVYLKKWLCHMVRYPEILPMVCINIIGSSVGLGKNLVALFIGKLIGDEKVGLLGNQEAQSNFNKRSKLWLLKIGNEANYAGDTKLKDKQKTEVTDETRIVEAKGEDTVEMFNCLRHIVFSNRDTGSKLEADDRRDLVLNSKLHYGKDYAIKLRNKIKQTGLYYSDSFFIDLMTEIYSMDLSEFVPSDKPARSAYHQKQIVRQLDGVHAFWSNALENCVNDGEVWKNEITAKDLYEEYQNVEKNRNNIQYTSFSDFTELMDNLLPEQCVINNADGKSHRKRTKNNSSRIKAYKALNDRGELKKHFYEFLKLDYKEEFEEIPIVKADTINFKGVESIKEDINFKKIVEREQPTTEEAITKALFEKYDN